MRLRAVIADDEPLARSRIRTLLADEPDVEVAAECRNGTETVAAVRTQDPDLLFLDIHMPEMDGFQVLEALARARVPDVVFVTAHDQYAVRAFEVHAADYLLKPFDRSRFRDALERVRQHLRQARPDRGLDERVLAVLEELRTRARPLRRFVVKSAGRIIFLDADQVQCIEAGGNYMRLYVRDKLYTIRDTMTHLENRLDPDQFMRIHRSWIINLAHIDEIHPWFHGDQVVVLRGGRKVQVGRGYRGKLARLLQM